MAITRPNTLIGAGLLAYVDVATKLALTGAVTNRVVVKTASGEAPIPSARVLLLRASDGRRAWSGFSDESGAYTALGLVAGDAYVPVATDPTGKYQATAAGPVTAAKRA